MNRNFTAIMLAATIVLGAFIAFGQFQTISESPCQLFFIPNPESGKTVPYLQILLDAEEFEPEDVKLWVTQEEFIAPGSVSEVDRGDGWIFHQLDYFDDELNVPGRGVQVEWLHGERPLHFVYSPTQFKAEYMLSYTCPKIDLQDRVEA